MTDAARVTEGYPGKGNKDRRVKKTLKSNLKSRRKIFLLFVAIGVLIASLFPVSAAMYPEAKMIILSEDSIVNVTFEGSSAAFNNLFGLWSPEYKELFWGHSASPGTKINLGYFPSYTELIFFIKSPQGTFLSGPRERNPDGVVHAAITEIGFQTWRIGFEDLWGGGDRDYNDITVLVKGDVYIIPPNPQNPDFIVLPVDITFSNDNPIEGDIIEIKAKIHNLGKSTGSNIEVGFYDGDPDDGGQLLSLAIINGLNKEENMTVVTQWNTVGKSGTHSIYVKVDPENVIREINEDNNKAHKFINIIGLQPDLTISINDIVFSNLSPAANEEITITATIHNIGNADANNILVQFYDGDPDNGGILIGEQVISSITAGSSATAQINWIAQEGTHEIYVVIDPNNDIAESNEGNNIASKSLEVTIALPDLTVSPNDIIFSNPDPQTTDITFKVTIHNNGEADATNVVVQFFDGDPETGQLIATANIQSIQAGDSSTVETWWDVSCSSTEFSVRIDPDNLIEEENEDNNEYTVTSPIGEEQKLLEKLNGVGVFHFYEEFYDYFNDNIPPDDKKSSICSLEDDDIWILYQFPYGLNWMYGDDLTCSLDANLWYSGVDPNGNEPIDVSVDLADFIPSELAEPLHYLECTVRGNGFPTFNPIYYDWDQSRAEILAKPEISAYAAGLPKIYASGNVYLYYNPYTDALEFERDFDQINAGATLRINEYSIPFDEELFIFTTSGQIDIGLDADLRGGFKFGESLVPKAVVPSGRAEEDVSGEINLVVEDLGIFDYPPYMEATITPINTPYIMLEGAIATEDFQPGESITSPFESNVEYRNFKAWEPVGRVKLSEIAVNVAGTIYYDLVGPVPPATYDFDFTLNLIPEGEFTIGNTEIIVHSPVNIHVYDERGRHVGINEFGNVEEEIPNSTYLEDAGKKVIRIPSLVDRFIVMVEGTGEGKYNLSISKPLLIDIDGNETITYITFNFNNITTSKGDRDYFDIDTQKIIREIKNRLKDKSIDEAIEEVVTTTDFDHDGIPHIKDTNMQFERRVVTLLAPNVEAQPNSSVRLTSRLIYLDKPIPSKEIDFKLDGKDIGSSTTNGEGIAYLDYQLKNESIGIHEITIVFEGDEEYGNATVNALLNIIDKPPEVEITSPNNYERVSGKITIDGNVSDINLESISLIIDGTEVSKSLPFEWNTTKYQHGPHIIQLFAIDGSGNKGTDAVVVFVNQPPVADANGPYAGIEGQTVEFNASASCDPEGMPLTYYWEFGDGNKTVTTQPTTSHVYAQEGNYTVTLIVNDSVQNSTPSIIYALINDTEPKANFTANVTSGFAPLTVQFNDSSVSYDGITGWEWDFDEDGTVDSNEQNPTHTYDEAGTYTVSLTVHESDGDSDTETKTDYITVTSAADTEPPTIESVTLDTYINIPNSSFHVTVEATDNVGVTSVTADGTPLTKTGSTWEGDIFIPEGTPEGEYTLTIIAQDEAGNTAESSVNYSVVFPQGGFTVAINPMMSFANAGDVKVYQIKIISNENFDDRLHVYISDEGIPDAYRADFEFNWTDKTVYMMSGDTVELSLEVTIPSASGYRMFRVYADSMRFRTSGYCTGIVLIS